jgi:hypothetical protein
MCQSRERSVSRFQSPSSTATTALAAQAPGADRRVGATDLWVPLTENDDNVFHPGGGWDYGSAGPISGHEGDTLHDTCPLLPPGSTTIWWQRP